MLVKLCGRCVIDSWMSARGQIPTRAGWLYSSSSAVHIFPGLAITVDVSNFVPVQAALEDGDAIDCVLNQVGGACEYLHE